MRKVKRCQKKKGTLSFGARVSKWQVSGPWASISGVPDPGHRRRRFGPGRSGMWGQFGRPGPEPEPERNMRSDADLNSHPPRTATTGSCKSSGGRTVRRRHPTKDSRVSFFGRRLLLTHGKVRQHRWMSNRGIRSITTNQVPRSGSGGRQ